ncbi:hypothetical protein MTR67_025848 [Solanum verrucosum]|uniref:Uncharacterized protein n=1 Tax=Solanum verrucosum TaxID=315347 RepID=A0AAF0R1M4_SOLVR|nr:hypothetical protein MTR67_025848 [Solanum verrucosum]
MEYTFLSSQFSGILPENNFDDGWLGIVHRIESFINKGLIAKQQFWGTRFKGTNFQRNIECGSYIGAINKSRWTQREPEVMPVQNLQASSSPNEKDLPRYLGWLESEEETSLKNHLCWARLRVKRPAEKIPPLIEITDGDLIFTLLIWCMPPMRYRHSKLGLPDNQDVNPRVGG